MDLRQLQGERAIWLEKNFTPRLPHQPALGMVEEFGELMEAISAGGTEEIGDALAHVVFSAADVCHTYELDLAELWEESYARFDGNALEPTVPLGRLCYAALKIEQGLEGAPAKHRLTMVQALIEILACLMCAAKLSRIEALVQVQVTWDELSRLTWRCQNPRCWKPLSRQDMGEYCSPECRAAALIGLF